MFMKSGILATETALSAGTEGLFLPVEFLTMGVLGSMAIAKKIKHNKQEKQQSREAEQARQQQEAQQRIADENARIEQERIARLQEQERLAQEQLARQQAEEQKRQAENQAQIERVQLRDQQIMDQLNIDRNNRINEMEGGINWVMPEPVQQIEEADNRSEEQKQADIILGRDGHGQWQYPYNPNAPVPNNGGGDPNGGNNNGGGGGNNPNPNNGGNSSNPYNALILSLASQIAMNKQKEEEKKPDAGDNTTPIPTPDPSKPDEFDPNYDDIHLIENQLLAMLNAQGLSELTNEQQVAELDKIQKSIPVQVKVDPSNVYSSTLVSF